MAVDPVRRFSRPVIQPPQSLHSHLRPNCPLQQVEKPILRAAQFDLFPLSSRNVHSQILVFRWQMVDLSELGSKCKIGHHEDEEEEFFTNLLNEQVGEDPQRRSSAWWFSVVHRGNRASIECGMIVLHLSLSMYYLRNTI